MTHRVIPAAILSFIPMSARSTNKRIKPDSPGNLPQSTNKKL